jgi:hypothetical protein
MRADIKLKPVIKLIPHFRFTFERYKKYWFKYSINFDWLFFDVDIDNF